MEKKTASVPAAKIKKSDFERSRYLTGVFFLVPATVLSFIFVIIPLINVVRYSFYEWNGISDDMVWVGLQNFKTLPTTEGFWQMCISTLIFAFGSTALIVLFSFIVAMALDSKNRNRVSRAVYRTAWFFPCILSGSVVGILWRIMYNYNNGMINKTLKGMGLSPVNWLETYGLTNVAIIIAAVWFQMGLCIVIFLAGLQSISTEINEAAAIDGANEGQIRRHIIVPLMAPSITINVLTTSIAAFKMYEMPWLISNGLPGYSTRLLTQRIHFFGIESAKFGLGSAMAVLLILVITAISLVQLVVLRKREDIY